jgi:hypothetical protein
MNPHKLMGVGLENVIRNCNSLKNESCQSLNTRQSPTIIIIIMLVVVKKYNANIKLIHTQHSFLMFSNIFMKRQKKVKNKL